MAIIKSENDYISTCKRFVRLYVLQTLNRGEEAPNFDVYCVWYVKALQNFKGLFSTTISDGMYYELTYSGDRNEMYLDAYKRIENKCIKIDEE